MGRRRKVQSLDPSEAQVLVLGSRDIESVLLDPEDLSHI